MKQIKGREVINQSDLKVDQLVLDVIDISVACLLKVVVECTDRQSLLMEPLTYDSMYDIIKDENGWVGFGTSITNGDIGWYVPTQEEIELIKNIDK